MSRRMIADIHELIVCEATSTDWTDLRLEDYDITDAVIAAIGEDPTGENLAAFANDATDFPEFSTMLMEDPEICFHPVLDLAFDILDFLQPGLTLSAPDSEIAAAWKRWRDAVMEQSGAYVSDRKNWSARAEELTRYLQSTSSRNAPSDVYRDYAEALVQSPEMLQAIGAALSGWKGDPVVGLRQVQVLQEALFAARKT